MQSLKILLPLALCLTGDFLKGSDAEALVARMIARDEQQTEALKQYHYRQTLVIDKLDGRDRVKESQTLEMQVRPGEGGFTLVTTEKGAALLPDQISDQEYKAAKEGEKLKANFTLRKLAPRFQVEILREDVFLGVPVTVLRFSPKTDAQDYTDRIEKILNQLQGTMWVHQVDATILKTEASLAKPVDLAWFLATMETMAFHYTAQPLAGSFGPASFEVGYRVSIFLGELRQRQRMTMRDFQLVR
jgi:hypothetical protein